ncbi:hypothetical protein ABG067_003836 [Albugo candida]
MSRWRCCIPTCFHPINAYQRKLLFPFQFLWLQEHNISLHRLPVQGISVYPSVVTTASQKMKRSHRSINNLQAKLLMIAVLNEKYKSSENWISRYIKSLERIGVAEKPERTMCTSSIETHPTQSTQF